MNVIRMRHHRVWSIVLAGGDGERLRPFIQRWLGYHKPKQYCSFTGTRSMLQHTLDRADQLTAPSRTITICNQAHQEEARRQLVNRPAGTVIFQPSKRGTVAGILLPLLHIRAHDPQATVVIYPSDHFVYPESRFLDIVQRAIWAAQWLDNRVVLLGVSPSGPELDFGWVQPGRHLGWTAGHGVRAVQAFKEKPDLAQAYTAQVSGALWNTMIVASKVETLWRLAWRCVPDIMPMFERIGKALGSPLQQAVLDAAYQAIPARDFSSDVLQKAADQLAVIELGDIMWNDWGKVGRIVDSLRRIGTRPAFPFEFTSWVETRPLQAETSP